MRLIQLTDTINLIALFVSLFGLFTCLRCQYLLFTLLIARYSKKFKKNTVRLICCFCVSSALNWIIKLFYNYSQQKRPPQIDEPRTCWFIYHWIVWMSMLKRNCFNEDEDKKKCPKTLNGSIEPEMDTMTCKIINPNSKTDSADDAIQISFIYIYIRHKSDNATVK